MLYLDFKESFKDYPVFSVEAIRKKYPNLDKRRLVEWQHKGYILNIRRGFYCFKDFTKDEKFLYFVSNKIYNPSYLSLESALAYYNFIPEGVFSIISVTSINTADFDTPIGRFQYKHVKPILFFGYKLMEWGSLTIKVAEPEKALLDYFYLNPLNTLKAIKELRLNVDMIKDTIDFMKLEQYIHVFNSSVLNKRIKFLKKIINA